MITASYHEPKKLAEMFESFLDEVTTGSMSSVTDEAKVARLKKMLADHKKLVPITPE